MPTLSPLAHLNATLQQVETIRHDLARLRLPDPFSSVELEPEAPLAQERLVVAFYGATNAGKSTLVEAIVGGDGASIGDGRKDFTERVREVHCGALVVRDLPGIAGREGGLLREIATGLRGVHVAVLVLGDRLPDEDVWRQFVAHTLHVPWVGCVLNTRVPPSRVWRTSDGTLAQRRELEAEVSRRLGRHFGHRLRGVWEVHAQLAHVTRAEGIRQRYDRKKAAYLDQFSSAGDALQHSSLPVLLDHLDGLHRASPDVHTWARCWPLLARFAVLAGALHAVLPTLRHQVRVAEEQADAARSRAEALRMHSRGQIESAIRRWGDDTAAEMLHLQQEAAQQQLGARVLSIRLDTLNRRSSAEAHEMIQRILDEQRAHLERTLLRSVRRAGLQAHLSAPPELGMTLQAAEVSLLERGALSLVAEGIGWLFTRTLGVWGLAAGVAQILWSHTPMAKARRARAQRAQAHQRIDRWRVQAVGDLWAAALATLRQTEADVHETLSALDDEVRARRALVARVEALIVRVRAAEIAALASCRGGPGPAPLLLPLAQAHGQPPVALLQLPGPTPNAAQLPLPVLNAAQARARGLLVPEPAGLKSLLAEAATILPNQ